MGLSILVCKTTQMSINGGLDKGEVIHIYNGILLSYKKEQICRETWMDLESYTESYRVKLVRKRKQ